MAKQRIGTAASPSFYSRLSAQIDAAEKHQIQVLHLKNEMDVVLIPEGLLPMFMASITDYFKDNSTYVAIGSKRRGDANTAYKRLNDIHNPSKFYNHLIASSFSTTAANQYMAAIKLLQKESLIAKYKKVFVAYDSVQRYPSAVEEFLSQEDVKDYVAAHNSLLSSALPAYAEFLIEEYPDVVTENQPEEPVSEPYTTLPDTPSTVHEDSYSSTPNSSVNYLSPYMDEHGKLTHIADPVLLDLLRPDLDTDYPRLIGALNTIQEYYGKDRFPNMELHDWSKLFDKIHWKAPKVSQSACYDRESKPPKSSVRKKIRVEFPTGEVIQPPCVKDALIAVVNYVGADKIFALGACTSEGRDTLLVAKSILPVYRERYSLMDNGYYLYVCTNTQYKYKQICQLDELFHIGLKVEIV
jgi:hypothetical protein